MNKYPDSWEIEKLGNLCKRITKGTTPRNYSSKGVNFIKVESITKENTLLREKFASISIQIHEELKRSQLEEGDIIFSIAGSLGKLAEVNQNHLPANTNQALAIVRLANESIDRTFCKYQLTSSLIKERIKKLGTVGAQPNLSLQQVSDLEIPVPPMPEQKRIADILSQIDKLVLKIQEKINKLEILKRGLISEFFTKGIGHSKFQESVIGLIPENWKVLSVKQISIGGSKNGIYKSKSYYGYGFEMVHMNNVFNSEVILNGNMQKVDVNEKEEKQFFLKKDDLLFARRSLVLSGAGKCSIVGQISKPVSFESSIIRVRPNSSLVSSKFCQFYFQSDFGHSQMMKIARQVAVSGITGEDLLKYLLPVPPLEEQIKIVNILNSLNDQILYLKEKEKIIIFTKKSLLQDLLSGRKRVNV